MEQILQSVFAFVAAHPKTVVALIVGWWLLSILASAMPGPQEIWPERAGAAYFAYRTFHNILHGVAGSWGRVSGKLRIGAGNNPKPPSEAK